MHDCDFLEAFLLLLGIFFFLNGKKHSNEVMNSYVKLLFLDYYKISVIIVERFPF